MPLSSRIARLLLGLLLGGIAGLLVYVSTTYQWSGSPTLQADLLTGYCCDTRTHIPSCSLTTNAGSCVGSLFTDSASCNAGCFKPYYCCKNGGTASAFCNAGQIGTLGGGNCDGVGVYPDVFTCTQLCQQGIIPPSSPTTQPPAGAQPPYCCNVDYSCTPAR